MRRSTVIGRPLGSGFIDPSSKVAQAVFLVGLPLCDGKIRLIDSRIMMRMRMLGLKNGLTIDG